MRSYTPVAAGVALCLMTVAPALAQTKPDSTKSQQTANQQQQPNQASSESAISSPTDPTKQKTQGLPAGTEPPQYGTDWAHKAIRSQ